MKKIVIAAMSLLLVLNSSAQVKIDRTKPPKAGPAPVIAINDPVIYKLPNGITILVAENHKLPKVSATYFIDYGPVREGNKAGELSLMGRMLNEGTTTMNKAAFDEAIDQMGANVNLSASGGTTSALTRYFEKAFMLMADGLRKPAFSPEAFEKIKSQSITALKANEKSAKAISARVVSALNYGLDHPEGEFETEETINSITLDDLKKMYTKYITPSNAYLTFVGDIKPEQAKALAMKAFGDWKGNTIVLPTLQAVKNPDKPEVDLINLSSAVQSEITVTNLVQLPMSSPDYFPVLLANNILGGHSDARLFLNLREKHGFTYGAYSNIGSGRYQSTFNAATSVRNEKADSAVAEILHEINNMRVSKVSDEELRNAKALYNGTFALGLEDPARTASFASTIIINKLSKDFYRTFLQRINAVTAEDIQRVAQKYFSYPNTRIVVVGKADAVQPGLAKLGFPVKMYDNFARPVTTNSSASSIKIAPKEVIAKYITAIGGSEELKKINSISSTGEMTMHGMNLSMVEKKMSPNMSMVEMSMNGQTIVHRSFDGKNGYQEQMGNKQPLSAEEVAENEHAKGLFPQLFYSEPGYILEMAGMEKVAGKDAYKINVTSPAGTKSTEYYDVETGYLVRSDKTSKIKDQDVQRTVENSNFKKVGNVLFPFTNSVSVQTAAGNQDFVIEINDIKLNEGVKVEDFK
jgi:Predicted Zn-dependent peptidases